MPAYVDRKSTVTARERGVALAIVALAELLLALALLSGLKVAFGAHADEVAQLISVRLRPEPSPLRRPKVERTSHSGPSARGPSEPHAPPAPAPAHAEAAPTPVVAVPAVATPAAGGGSGSTSAKSGVGGGSGGQGYGDGSGGTELVQIAGEIRPSDYPRDLRDAGIGGRVGLLFTVGTNGRVTRCTVTRSSGVPELDALTCRLIQQRFRYRPSTDRFGRPIADEVEGEHEWSASPR